MDFRFYTNAIAQASRSIAAVMFIAGLLLIGFGVIIIALPELFATLAAIVFSAAGAGCLIIAVKIFWAQHKLNKIGPDGSQGCRETRKNVRIHIEEHYEE
jgi:hypothetical protein